MKKRTMILVVSLIMSVALVGTAYAAYTTSVLCITYPSAGSADTSYEHLFAEGGMNPWINQGVNGSSYDEVVTKCWLYDPADGVVWGMATGFCSFDYDDYSTKYWTYNSGYGGANTEYRLAAGCSYGGYYEDYYVGFSWSTD